jgi:peptidoglycan/xylan/chitin deacetylase (PgdA/CDA1 family)
MGAGGRRKRGLLGQMRAVRSRLALTYPVWRARLLAAEFTPVAQAPLNLARGVLSIGFDDFPRSAWTEGGAVLDAEGVKGTYYVCGAHEDGLFEGVPQFGALDLEACARAGHEIGCHSFTHVSFLRQPLAAGLVALEQNRAFLARRLGIAPTQFAYPYGHASVAAKRALGARFDACRGVQGGLNAGVADLGQLRAHGLERRRIDFGMGLEPLLRRAATLKAWAIVYTHDVSNNPTPYGCRPADLQRVIRLAYRLGLDVAPTGAVVAALKASSVGAAPAQSAA